MVEIKQLPTRTEQAINQLINAASVDGFSSVQFGYTDGESPVGHLSLRDANDLWTFYWYDGVSWFSHNEVS